MKYLVPVFFLILGCKTPSIEADQAALTKLTTGFYNLNSSNVKKLKCSGELSFLKNDTNPIKPVALAFTLSREISGSVCSVDYDKSKYLNSGDMDSDISKKFISAFSGFCNSLFKAFYFDSPFNLVVGSPVERVGTEYVSNKLLFDSNAKYIKGLGPSGEISIEVDYKEVGGFNLPTHFTMKINAKNLSAGMSTTVKYKVVGSIPHPTNFQIQNVEADSKGTADLIAEISNCKVEQ